MTFRQFAFNNVSRNKRTYAAFFLSSVFSVMIFFIYAMFIYHPGVDSGQVHRYVAEGMKAAEYIIFLFAFFFLFYCVGAFLKRREKEFGILIMHGMTRGQQNVLIFMENMLIGAISILFGIGLGMVLGKLFFQFAGFLLDVEPLPFYLPWEAMVLTIVCFFCLYVVISLFTLLFLKRSSLLELLQGNQRPKQEPKASVFLSLLAAVLLGLAYVLAFWVSGPLVIIMLIPVSALTIAGTYLLFTQLSVYLIRLLKRNKRFYWNHTNIVTLSDLTYRMKDNARMFFLVCIVSTVAFCAVGTLAALASSITETTVKTNPFAFSYRADADTKLNQQQVSKIEAALKDGGFAFEKVETTVKVLSGGEDRSKNVALIGLSEYNRIAGAAGQDQVQVGPGEAIFFQRWPGEELDREPFPVAGQSLQRKISSLMPVISSLNSSRIVVVPDPVFAQITADSLEQNFLYNVENWKETDALSKKLMTELSEGDTGPYSFQARAPLYHELKQLANTGLFIGLFVGLLFFVAAGSFLYFRLYTDLENDKRQYGAITKIGLTERELSRIVTTQVALLFFIPILVAIIHSAVAFFSLHSLLKLILITSVAKPTAIVLASFVLVQFVYFVIIRNRYLFHLKRSM
ncbi:ABC transporter permease [Brevibacillus ruminantium]|uniref:ABC transporter permease n=1 Tax=Brevibacillus ruminantium TaxID=2950604 RepID=A0ABY4WGY6_9BACL|nr:ABC transporter permease [Brevibacillus ruminantium]USG66387.1 ABC transporter permease [Brevibacillus ruminantium]